MAEGGWANGSEWGWVLLCRSLLAKEEAVVLDGHERGVHAIALGKFRGHTVLYTASDDGSLPSHCPPHLLHPSYSLVYSLPPLLALSLSCSLAPLHSTYPLALALSLACAS